MLARPEYEPLRPSLLEQALAWAGEQVGRVIALLSGTTGGSLVAALVFLAVLAVAGVLLARFARGLRPGAQTAAPLSERPGRGAAEWLADAERLETDERWREGLRCRYRALIAALAERGVVEEVPGRTAGEYRTAVREALPAAANDFGRATALFEAAWYGHEPADAGRADALARAAGHVVAVADGRRAGEAVGTASSS